MAPSLRSAKLVRSLDEWSSFLCSQKPLPDTGACTVGLFVGSQTTQIELQPLGNVSVCQ